MVDYRSKKFKILMIIIIIAIVTSIVLIYLFTTYGTEERPAGTVISTDSFHEMSASSDLDCRGKVDLIQTSGGSYVLYFYEMTVDTWPTKVKLSEETSFSGQFDSLGANAEIGDLPYKYGSFSLAIPASVNPSLYQTVVIVHSLTGAIQGYAYV